MADSSEQSPQCLHVVGIGRSGAGYVDGLLRTGEIEDLLADPGARVAALVIDVGQDDLYRVEGYAEALSERLRERGIPEERFHFQSIALDMPQGSELLASLERAAKVSGGKKSAYKPWLPKDIALPDVGGHLPRAVAKAIYASAYYDGDRPLAKALEAFAAHAKGAELPSRAMVCFNLAGGTGSGMAVDLARHLSNEMLEGAMPVFGVGQLPHSGDGDMPASLFASLNELAAMSDDAKSAEVTKGKGDGQKNPFTGGVFIVNTEHSWQRLTAYTKTGEAAIRNRIRQEVTNKFAQDSFMRFAVRNGGAALSQALAAGSGGQSAGWMYFDLAKFTHPGVQVLPGEALSKWRKVIDQWIDHLDNFSGLRKDFRTDRADVHVHAPREIGFERLDAKLEQKISDSFLKPGEESNIRIANHEFFDYLTSYADIVLPGLAETDLDLFWQAHKEYDKLGAKQQKMCHSWLLEQGIVVSKPEARAS